MAKLNNTILETQDFNKPFKTKSTYLTGKKLMDEQKIRATTNFD